MSTSRRTVLIRFSVIFLVGILVFIVVPFAAFVAYFYLAPIIDGQGDIFVTNNISDYGIIIGNYDNDTPRDFIQSFFPGSIDEGYTDVVYHYSSKKLDSYSYEAYLEFVVQDKDSYELLIDSVTHGEPLSLFPYDQRYRQYVISDVLWISSGDTSQECWIERAQIGKVLFLDETQSVIFVAIGVYDGGGTRTEERNYFFSRFGIDPSEYATRTLGL